jgi:hypothetical protein
MAQNGSVYDLGIPVLGRKKKPRPQYPIQEAPRPVALPILVGYARRAVRILTGSLSSSQENMRGWSAGDQGIEAQGDEFALYLLMLLNGYRQQVSGPVDLDVMAHCADRYVVSLAAAILKWLGST